VTGLEEENGCRMDHDNSRNFLLDIAMVGLSGSLTWLTSHILLQLNNVDYLARGPITSETC